MNKVNFLKKLSFLFYFLTGIMPVLFLIVMFVYAGDIPDSVGGFFIMAGILFFISGLIFSAIARAVRLKKNLQLSQSDTPNNSSVYNEPKNNSVKMLKMGIFAMIMVGLILIGSVLVFWDGANRGSIAWQSAVSGLIDTFIVVGIFSFMLAAMRYFRR